MARRAKALPVPVLVVLLVIVAVAVWRQHKRAEGESGNPPVVVEPKDKKTPRDAPPAPAGGQTAEAENAALGMPSAASDQTPDDYLISKPQYVISYNRSHGSPNWVSWHLSTADLGPVERGQFAPDPSLPKSWPKITPADYRNIGFDRGHMCPSGDRTATKLDNAQTFLMTNIVPQAAGNNQGPWADLENFCRDLARKGNELYITCGVAGPFSPTSSPKLVSPASTWKVVVVLPVGDGDVARIDARTRVIAVVMPNTDDIRGRDWRSFRTSPSAIERSTGYHFFGNVPSPAREALDARVDAE
jgi:endonuclease G